MVPVLVLVDTFCEVIVNAFHPGFEQTPFRRRTVSGRRHSFISRLKLTGSMKFGRKQKRSKKQEQ